MAVQDKKVIGDKPGFVTPQKGVVFNPNQNNQGGSGGVASSANPSGLSKRPNEYKPPASTRSNTATEDPIGITDKLESGTKAVYNLPKTIGSTMINAAKGVGGAILGAGVGLANMASSDGSMRSTPKYDVEDVKNKIGSFVDSAITPSNYSSVINNSLARVGTNQPSSAPSINQPASSQVTINADSSDPNITSKFQAGLNSSPITPSFNKVTSGVREDIAERSNESKFDIDPKNYGVSSGKGGQFAYTRNEDGSISKLNLSTGSRQGLGNISSIGPNGSTVSRDLTDKEKEAMARSSQMISDWQDYKRQKEAQGLRNFIQANLGNQYITSSQRGEAIDRLNAIEKGDIDKQQIASQEGVQARTLGMTARKNAFEEQRETARLGIDSLKAQSEAQGRLSSQQNDTFKLIGEVDKNLGSTQDKIAVYKSRGMWNPLTIKATYPKEKLGSFKTPDELRQNLVNDESVDQGDIEDIVFSYFPSNQ